MSWEKVAEFPADRDLVELNRWLTEQEYPHRFTIEGDSQVLWTPYTHLVEPLQRIVEQFLAGALAPSEIKAEKKAEFQSLSVYAPLTLALLMMSFAGSALFSLGQDFISLFTFYDLTPFYRNRTAFSDILDGEVWRLVSPVFLHFGLIHIVFNAMWLWYLGSRLEQVIGGFWLLAAVISIALVSNLAQALMSYPIPFGGMSGVVFGLLGFFWLLGRSRPDPRLFMPPALFPIMLVLMLISVFGAFDWMADAEVADTAHIVGLGSGLLACLAYLGLTRGKQA